MGSSPADDPLLSNWLPLGLVETGSDAIRAGERPDADKGAKAVFWVSSTGLGVLLDVPVESGDGESDKTLSSRGHLAFTGSVSALPSGTGEVKRRVVRLLEVGSGPSVCSGSRLC